MVFKSHMQMKDVFVQTFADGIAPASVVPHEEWVKLSNRPFIELYRITCEPETVWALTRTDDNRGYSINTQVLFRLEEGSYAFHFSSLNIAVPSNAVEWVVWDSQNNQCFNCTTTTSDGHLSDMYWRNIEHPSIEFHGAIMPSQIHVTVALGGSDNVATLSKNINWYLIFIFKEVKRSVHPVASVMQRFRRRHY